jgi:hypothetical protein
MFLVKDERAKGERKSGGKMNEEELDLNPSFQAFFSVYSFIQMPLPKRGTKLEDF